MKAKTHHETAVREDEPVYLEQQLALYLGLWDLAPHEMADLVEDCHGGLVAAPGPVLATKTTGGAGRQIVRQGANAR